MKITVEDILDLYDPCRDHEVLFSTSMDVDQLVKLNGMKLQLSQFINCEVDSIGVRDGLLAIWPTDESLRAALDNPTNYKIVEEFLLKNLGLYKKNPELQAIILESWIQTFGPLSNETGEKVKKILGENDGAIKEE